MTTETTHDPASPAVPHLPGPSLSTEYGGDFMCDCARIPVHVGPAVDEACPALQLGRVVSATIAKGDSGNRVVLLAIQPNGQSNTKVVVRDVLEQSASIDRERCLPLCVRKAMSELDASQVLVLQSRRRSVSERGSGFLQRLAVPTWLAHLHLVHQLTDRQPCAAGKRHQGQSRLILGGLRHREIHNCGGNDRAGHRLELDTDEPKRPRTMKLHERRL